MSGSPLVPPQDAAAGCSAELGRAEAKADVKADVKADATAPSTDDARRWLQDSTAVVASACDMAQRLALAWALKDIANQQWNANPVQAQVCAERLSALTSGVASPQLEALQAWTQGLAHLSRGGMTDALHSLRQAEQLLLTSGMQHEAARCRLPQIVALAMLGRFDEALTCGQAARAQFVAVADHSAAGKVELNLGSMLLRQDRHAEAAAAYRQAAVRFARAGDSAHSVMADIGLAGALAWQFDFDEALRLYDRAAMRVAAHGTEALQGVIDTNRGRLQLQRGCFEPALKDLSAALREAERDGLPQDVAEAQRDLADVYLALHLLPEAIALYDEVVGACTALDAPQEHVWALLQRARAQTLLGQLRPAAEGLASAHALFALQANAVGVAMADLRSAELALRLGDGAQALLRARAAAGTFAQVGAVGWQSEAALAVAQALAALGRHDEARLAFEALLSMAQSSAETTVACQTGLGLLSLQRGDVAAAQRQLQQAVRTLAMQRAALPGDEYRSAYGADQRSAHEALLALAFDDTEADAALRLLHCLEHARSQALGSAVRRGDVARGIEPARREQLRWLDEQWQQAVGHGQAQRAAQLQTRARQLEREWLESERRAQADRGGPARSAPAVALTAIDTAPEVDIHRLQARLPAGGALVSYGISGARWAACVVTAHAVRRVTGSAVALDARITLLRAQIDTLRFGAPALHRHSRQLAQRATAHLQHLYQQLWQPLAHLVEGCERIVVVPHRSLHYVPFCALHDGRSSLLDRHALSLTPSVALWLGDAAPWGGSSSRPLRRVVAFGCGGASLPHAAAEARAVAAAFAATSGGSAALCLEQEATHDALRAALPGADVLHLACHGQFRADSPYFSALQLADGPLTVRDAAALPLRAGLVTLSACETGLSRIAPGDELLGLLRGFLLAGAPAVLTSLWTVDDTSTCALMAAFYARLLGGASAPAALRGAQQALKADHPHPYHWAPFALHERG